MADFTLREATLADVPELSLIGQGTFLESYADLIQRADIIKHCQNQHGEAAYQTYLTDGVSKAWIAEMDSTGAPIGYALMTAPDLPVELKPGDAELKRIYVYSKFQGTGAGRALMATVEAEAQAKRAPRLLLGTYEDNQRALNFYAKAGFETIGTRTFQVGDACFCDLVLGKVL